MFIKTKSPETYILINNKLDILLTEQRHQRIDLSTIKRQLHTIIVDLSLQKQVTDYMETSPQTEQEEQNGNRTGN